MAYCLDANVFIEAHRVRYPHEIAPGFWDATLELAQTGKLLSIEAVYEELRDGKDWLAGWCKTHRKALFRPNDDAATQRALHAVDRAMEDRRPAYTATAKRDFLDGADPWLIAYCEAHRHTLVTMEVGDAKSPKKVRIPDIADLVGVETVDLLDMLRSLKVRLVAG